MVGYTRFGSFPLILKLDTPIKSNTLVQLIVGISSPFPSSVSPLHQDKVIGAKKGHERREVESDNVQRHTCTKRCDEYRQILSNYFFTVHAIRSNKLQLTKLFFFLSDEAKEEYFLANINARATSEDIYVNHCFFCLIAPMVSSVLS